MSSRYIPALDGLRALAVIAVVIYHMNATALQSGLLGVTIFFVLSGYLITGLLIREWSTTKKINLPQFWLRRVRRLFPAIVFVLLGTIVLTGVFAPDMLTKLRNDIVAALLFFTNWWYIFQDVSYFEAMGAPSPVTHFWSLAIEEQFYLIWPPLLLLLFSKRVKKRHIQLGLLVAAIASAAAMAILYSPQADPSRVYYGTDTRAFSLLIGAFLAFEFPPARVNGHGRQGFTARDRKIALGVGSAALAGILVMMVVIGAFLAFEFPPARVNGHGRQGFTARDRKIALGVGSAALAGILVMMVAVNGYSPFLYYGGIALLSLLTGALIITLADGRSPLARFFALRPLVWIGKLSYSIYLWHYPLLLLMNPQNFTGETPWFAYVGQALVILAASAISYYVVETPLRKGAIGKAIKGIREKQFTAGEYALHHAVQLGAGCILAVAAVACLIAVPPTATQQNTQLESAVVTPEAPPEDAPEAPEERTVEEMLASTEGETPADKARNTDFLMIGDSVSVALSDSGGYGYFGDAFPRATLEALSDSGGYGYFGDAFPRATLDAAIGRQLYTAKDVYQQHVDGGWNGPAVIFEVGTNGPATADDVREMVEAAIGRQLYTAKDVYQQHVDGGWNGPAVIFEVGTNGPATADDVREMVESVPPDKYVYLVNVRSPDPLQDVNNALLQQAADEHENVRIIDWHAASAGHDEYFDGDGTHLTAGDGLQDVNNALLQQAADEHENVRIIDWHAASAGHDEYFDGDGTHLTAGDGCQAYLALIAGALEELYAA